jgi:hypothetical protein
MCRGKQELLALSNGPKIPRGFFVMFTSQPGFKSYTRRGGSLFIDKFTEFVKTRATIWHLEKIFEKTAQTVSEKNQGGVKQQPQSYNNCKKDIWLVDEGE